MRLTHLTILTLVTSFPFVALAKKAPAPVEDTGESAAARAARLALSDDTGSLRDSDLRASVQIAPVTSGAGKVERAPAAQSDARATGPLSGVLEELVGRQMERNAAVFDRCVADAKRRDPNLHGDVELAITVVAKKTVGKVATPSADAGLSSCLVAGARTLRVSLPDLTFPWKVSLGQSSAATASAAPVRAALP